MKTISFLLSTMLLFIGLANAQTTTYEYKYALETPVNIRSGQGTKHDIVGQLKEDERFEMDAACKSGWCKARAGSIEGYVHISQAKQAVTPAKTTEPTKAAEPAKAAEPVKAKTSGDAEESSFEWWMIPVGLLMLIVLWKIKWWIISTIVTAIKYVFVEIIGGVMAFFQQNKE